MIPSNCKFSIKVFASWSDLKTLPNNCLSILFLIVWESTLSVAPILATTTSKVSSPVGIFQSFCAVIFPLKVWEINPRVIEVAVIEATPSCCTDSITCFASVAVAKSLLVALVILFFKVKTSTTSVAPILIATVNALSPSREYFFSNSTLNLT